jgi:hypothetical protein
MKNRIYLIATISLLLISVSSLSAQTAKPAATSAKPMLPYSIQVERVTATVDGVPAEFSAAIYENLIDALTKSGRFQQVLRSGDNRAASTGNLITLKTTVQNFQEGSETKRAVTTVSGATKMVVHMQVTGADGKPLVDKDVEGAVHFIGTNLRATLNLANSMVKQLEAGLAPTTAKK